MVGMTNDRLVLTINTGSSSLKFVLYAANKTPVPILRAQVNRIGAAGSRIRITGADGAVQFERETALADHAAALEAVLDQLARNRALASLKGVGHRIVHGGARYREPQWITPELVDALRDLAPLDPDHVPQALCGIDTIGRRFPDLPQAACFDTAFHAGTPPRAEMYALPRRFYEAGIRHFGFHGLSYEYIVAVLREREPALADGRLIVAHLGNGASVAAIRNGRSIDTSMGYTPAAGLVMSTRCGDIDPGVLLDLAQQRGMDTDAINRLINHESGLLGVSQRSADMRDLLEAEMSDSKAAEAIDMFCYRARKYIGAYAAALGGLDALVFTGGIGEHAATIRERICAGLEFLGIKLDATRNHAAATVISTDDSPVHVRVMETDENLMIARHTVELLNGGCHVRFQHRIVDCRR
ncbi:MAG TPA: acetate/propionate family kinase [Gammaproteobacteria bacterium]|nr:acetate/propionate family kinase [Gammaproteobacteria bacterium]